MYLDYDGSADAGDYEFILSCDGVASNKASYKVNKRAASITSGSATKVYDGTPLTCDTYETTGFLDGQGVYVTCTGECTGSEGQVKTTAPNTFTYVAQEGTNIDNYSITEAEGTLTVVVQLFVVTAGNYCGMYDGIAHYFNDATNGTQVKVVTKNGIDYTSVATFEYAISTTGKEGPWSSWGPDKPSVKNVGNLYVKVRATATIAGQTSPASLESDAYTMEVTKRNVTLTSGDKSKQYDGTALKCEAMSEGGDGFADTEGASYTYTGTQTKAGSSANDFNYTLTGGASDDNYNITKIEGTLTVTPKSAPITIWTASGT